jgi:hypothetical protein
LSFGSVCYFKLNVTDVLTKALVSRGYTSLQPTFHSKFIQPKAIGTIDPKKLAQERGIDIVRCLGFFFAGVLRVFLFGLSFFFGFLGLFLFEVFWRSFETFSVWF